MAVVGLFPSLAGLPLVGNAVTGFCESDVEMVGTHSSDSFLSGPSPDVLLGTLIRDAGGPKLSGLLAAKCSERGMNLDALTEHARAQSLDLGRSTLHTWLTGVAKPRDMEKVFVLLRSLGANDLEIENAVERSFRSLRRRNPPRDRVLAGLVGEVSRLAVPRSALGLVLSLRKFLIEQPVARYVLSERKTPPPGESLRLVTAVLRTRRSFLKELRSLLGAERSEALGPGDEDKICRAFVRACLGSSDEAYTGTSARHQTTFRRLGLARGSDEHIQEAREILDSVLAYARGMSADAEKDGLIV